MCRGCTAADFSDHFLFDIILSGNRPPSSRPGQTLFAPTSLYSASLKGYLYNCKWLAYGSFQFTHITWWAGAWVEWAMVPEGRKLLKCTQFHHQGEFRHVSISALRQSWQCSQNLRGSFLIAVLPMKVEVSGQAIAAD